MNNNTKESDFKYSLPEIHITDPKTGDVLFVATPQPGEFFDIKIPQGITADQLLVSLREMTTFHYKTLIAVQRALMAAGVKQETVHALFFPGVPSTDSTVRVVDPAKN